MCGSNRCLELHELVGISYMLEHEVQKPPELLCRARHTLLGGVEFLRACSES
jgi:hypothetical protein